MVRCRLENETRSFVVRLSRVPAVGETIKVFDGQLTYYRCVAVAQWAFDPNDRYVDTVVADVTIEPTEAL